MTASAILLSGGTIYDGTGAAPVAGDVLVVDGQIEAVGDLDGMEAAETLDLARLALFWSRSHSEGRAPPSRQDDRRCRRRREERRVHGARSRLRSRSVGEPRTLGIQACLARRSERKRSSLVRCAIGDNEMQQAEGTAAASGVVRASTYRGFVEGAASPPPRFVQSGRAQSSGPFFFSRVET